MDYPKKLWTTREKVRVYDDINHNLIQMNDIKQGMEIIRQLIWDIIPAYLRDGWWHHKKIMEDLEHNHSTMPSSLVWHSIRNVRYFIRAIILLGYIHVSQLPVGSYDDPSSPLPIPSLCADNKMDEDEVMPELTLPPTHQDLYE